MKNCLIMGSGRSGTSMIAGMLAKEDYFFGDNLYQARDPNPKGFFEDPEINDINETILSQVTLRRPPLMGPWLRTEFHFVIKILAFHTHLMFGGPFYKMSFTSVYFAIHPSLLKALSDS